MIVRSANLMISKFTEDLLVYTNFIIIVLTAIWVTYSFISSIKSVFIIVTGKAPKPNKFDKLLLDKGFVCCLRDIVEEEGGIHVFMDKLRPLIPHEDWDHNNFWSVRSFSFKIVAGIYARPIIEKIIESDGFKSYMGKEKIGNNEIESYSNGLWFLMSQYSFKKTYRSMLANAGLETNFADREMTDEEKRRFFNFD